MESKVVISKRLAVVNSACAFLSQTINLTVLVWLQQYLLRRIGPEEYSIYPVVVGLLLFIPMWTLVMTGGLSRYVNEAYARDDQRRVTQLVTTMAPVNFLTAAGLWCLGAVLSWNIDHILTIEPHLVRDAQIMFLILVSTASLRVAAMPFRLGLYVRQKFVWMYAIGLCSEVIRVVTLILLLYGVSTRVLWVVVATIPPNLFELALTIPLSMKLVPALRPDRKEYRKELIRPLFAFAGWGSLLRLSVVVREMTCLLILNRLSTPVEVTSFSLGAMVDTKVRRAAISPLAPTRPIIIAMEATGQHERQRNTYFRMGRYLAWALMLAMVPLVIYRADLFALYLREKHTLYLAAGTVMALLLLRLPFSFPMPLIAMISGAKGDLRAIGLLSVGQELSVVLLALVLVGGYGAGALGVAVAMFGVSAVVFPVGFWILGLRMTDATFAQWFRRSLIPGFLPAVCALPVWLLGRWLWPPESWIALGSNFLLGALPYLLVLGLFCLQEDERRQVRKVLSRIRAWLPGAPPQRQEPE